MSEMPIAEQHKIVHELVDRYKFETKAIYYYTKECATHRFIVESFTDFKNNCILEHSFLVRIIDKIKLDTIMIKSIQELQETCFQDLLNPTENELILFELQYGFEWPLMEC